MSEFSSQSEGPEGQQAVSPALSCWPDFPPLFVVVLTMAAEKHPRTGSQDPKSMCVLLGEEKPFLCFVCTLQGQQQTGITCVLPWGPREVLLELLRKESLGNRSSRGLGRAILVLP